MNLAEQIKESIREVVGREGEFVALHEPRFEGNEWKYVKECIDTAWVSSVGKYVDRFEEELAEYTGASRSVAIVNGTSALHASLELLGISRGDEVLVPTLTFVATANAVSYTEATPHFVDSEPKTLGIDPDKLKAYLAAETEMREGVPVNLETDRPIKAIIAMHAFGHPTRIDELAEVCSQYNITLIEDAAESLGSFYNGTHTGRFGRVGILSFNGNKTITTGGGGAIITDDDELADEAKHLTTTAKVEHPWEYYHDQRGFNYRLPNINAALGCAQLEILPTFLERKRTLASRYKQAFENIEEVRFIEEPADTTSNYWLNAIQLRNGGRKIRDSILDHTNDRDIMTRPVWRPMHTLPMYENAPRMDVTQASKLASTVINIPSSPFLAD